jgi:hypothetical protein
MIIKLLYRCKNCRAHTCVPIHVDGKRWKAEILDIVNRNMTTNADINFAMRFHYCDDVDSEFGINELIKIIKK